MIFDSLDAVFYTAIFIMPGFLVKNIVDTLNPSKKTNDSVFFVSCLAYSLVNIALCSWAYVLIRPLAEDKIVIYWTALLGITLFISTIFAIFIGLLKQRRIIYAIADKLGIKLIDPTPTAWDYWFSKREASLVYIMLIDGREIRGWFGGDSFASSNPEERDIFVEKVYLKSTHSEQWEDNPENNGIYVPKDMIKFIEFKKSKEGNNNV